MVRVFTHGHEQLLQSRALPSLLKICLFSTGYTLFPIKPPQSNLSLMGKKITKFSGMKHFLLSVSVFHLCGFQVDKTTSGSTEFFLLPHQWFHATQRAHVQHHQPNRCQHIASGLFSSTTLQPLLQGSHERSLRFMKIAHYY